MKVPVQFGLTSFIGPKNHFATVFRHFEEKIDLKTEITMAEDTVTLNVEGNELEEIGAITLMYEDIKRNPEKVEVLKVKSVAMSPVELKEFKGFWLNRTN